MCLGVGLPVGGTRDTREPLGASTLPQGSQQRLENQFLLKLDPSGYRFNYHLCSVIIGLQVSGEKQISRFQHPFPHTS